ncbi:MAG: NAD(P)H-hydrate dehydratase [Planctomycetota bacterium]
MNRLESRDLPKLPKRRPDAHKGDFGHVFLLAGSPGMVGAGCLAAWGALRGGAGLVTVGCPRSLYPIFAGKLTEAMGMPLPETPGGALSMSGLDQIVEFAYKCKVVAVGPGMGRDPETAELVRALASRLDHVLILDADALSAFAGCAEAFSERRGPTLITPHPGEMGQLTGKSAAQVQEAREGTAAEFAGRFQVFAVLLKGASTIVTDGENLFVNPTGNPGMATGGSGDVLTGMTAALVAQRLDHFESGCLGAYVHGLAGDLAARKYGQISMTAGDIVSCLPAAFESWRTGVIPRRNSARS